MNKRRPLSDNNCSEISREMDLILACAFGNTAKVQEILLYDVNWSLVYQLSMQHQLYPSVSKMLGKLQNVIAPAEVFQQLKQLSMQSGVWAFQMAMETCRIAKIFSDHGVRAIVLKGAPLASRIYGDVAVRPSKDIDILVVPEDLKKVQDILFNNCYQGMRLQATLSERQTYLFLKLNNCRHFEYINKEKNIQIEIHWDIAYGLPMPTNNDINIIEMMNCSIPVLSDDLWLLFLIFHGAGHSWHRLRWLVDIALFIQQGNFNWARIKDIAIRSNKLAFLHQTFILLDRLLNIPVPDYFIRDLKQDRFAEKLANMALNISFYPHSAASKNVKEFNRICKQYDAKFRTGWRNKVHHYVRVIYPSVEDIKLIALPDFLFPLYFFIRPITWIGRSIIKIVKKR